MKKIKLSKNQIALVDKDDYKKLNIFKWYAIYNGNTFYALRFSQTKENKKYGILMHREILNAKQGVIIDHINGNPLDNRKRNLRFCTQQQNCRNKIKASKCNIVGIKGVNLQFDGKFVATIGIDYKAKYLGRFKTAKEAALAYRKAEIKYFKKFAR